MIIHESVNVTQETRRNNTHTPESQTGQINVLVTLRVRYLPSSNHRLVRRLILANTGNHAELFEEGSPCNGDGFANVGRVCNVEFQRHGAADVVDGVGDEFADEDIVIDAVADAAADDADGER